MTDRPTSEVQPTHTEVGMPLTLVHVVAEVTLLVLA